MAFIKNREAGYVTRMASMARPQQASFPVECMANDSTARTIQENLRILPEKKLPVW
jgi:hypothetical protein